jgi:Tfp pilus assembly protein PilN
MLFLLLPWRIQRRSRYTISLKAQRKHSLFSVMTATMDRAADFHQEPQVHRTRGYFVLAIAR